MDQTNRTTQNILDSSAHFKGFKQKFLQIAPWQYDQKYSAFDLVFNAKENYVQKGTKP